MTSKPADDNEGDAVELSEVDLKVVPEPSLRRLPGYVHFLRTLRQRGREVVSTTHIAKDLRLDPTQVRKDLAYTGIIGRPKVGYDVEELIAAIERFLGWNNSNDAFLVGAGALGTALLGHERFAEYGLRFVAAFDQDPSKQGKEIHGVPVLGMHKLVDLARRMHIHIGVLTVPAQGAQEAADLLMEGGIRAIWNFSPRRIEVVPDTVVVDAELYSTLSLLKRNLTLIMGR